MRFSIITVCLNAGSDLVNTVNSLLLQSFEDFEVIVKDGLSSDGSIDNLPVDKRIRLICKADKGVYDAMNEAVAEARGEFCIFINAGDKLYDNTTLEQIDNYISRLGGDFFYGKSYTISSDTINFGPQKVNSFFCYRSAICHQAMIIRTESLKKRGFDLSFRISADREWMVYAFKVLHLEFQRIPIMVSKYKGNGISSKKDVVLELQEENIRIRKRYFTNGELLKYGALYSLTLPRLRGFISRTPALRKQYYKLRYYLLGRKR